MNRSKSVVEALDRIREEMSSAIVLEYPNIANGPIETVLAFNNNELISLVEDLSDPRRPNIYFHTKDRPLTDLQHNIIPGSLVNTTFPVNPAELPQTSLWPPEQVGPWDAPPVKPTHLDIGYSKQKYSFDNGANSFVTVGPSLPKIVRLKNGAAQFWVGSIGMITQGEGRFEHAHGVSVYVGSGYLPKWPDQPAEQIDVLKGGFVALVACYCKFVPYDQIA